MSPASDAGNAGLPCVWSLGIPPHLAHRASNATTRNVFNSYFTCILYGYSFSQLHFWFILILIRHYISHLLSYTLKSMQLSLNNGIPLSSLILELTPSTSSQNFEIPNKRHQTIALRLPRTIPFTCQYRSCFASEIHRGMYGGEKNHAVITYVAVTGSRYA